MSSSGSAIRRIGRRRRESSPVSSTVMSHGASTPMSRRTVVPELPQSMASSGCEGPKPPQPRMSPARLPSGRFSRLTSAPRARTAPMEERTSAESSTPDTCEVPSAIAEKSTERCEIDLSPGTRTAPDSGRASGSMRVACSAAAPASLAGATASPHTVDACWSLIDMNMLLRGERIERHREARADELGRQLPNIALVG